VANKSASAQAIAVTSIKISIQTPFVFMSASPPLKLQGPQLMHRNATELATESDATGMPY
jgi:hypothetical protein